jgi:hypothetical protein
MHSWAQLLSNDHGITHDEHRQHANSMLYVNSALSTSSKH